MDHESWVKILQCAYGADTNALAACEPLGSDASAALVTVLYDVCY
ncbi:MAG: hypothetical protein ACTSRF_12320 [Candidatus Freyarchaeota archaeon]